MSGGRVLGFRKKDAVTFIAEDQKEPTYSIWEKQLVPVVSLLALKKWCKENAWKFSRRHFADGLLVWAEKAAKRK